MRAPFFAFLALMFHLYPCGLEAEDRVPPGDLWTDEVLLKVRDRSTLEYDTAQHAGYADVFFTSNPSAGWFDAAPPYQKHEDGRIRIHGYMAYPPAGGPYPALVIGHGHGGRAELSLALQVASLGYVALAIDGPQAGLSTGGPQDENQAWISVDSGPEYGYLYHYAYAGMRALTLLEALAGLQGNPYRIDASKLGVLGASMGGILTSHINGIDSRVRAAVIIAAAGQWQHAMRFPNSWLYHGLYTGTRDLPYDGKDPLNSIENIDTDPTAVAFINYFDPIRYAPRQHAPVMVVVGTHDGYFPMTCANQMSLGIASAGTRTDFEKRLWLVPNAPHSLDNPQGLLLLVGGLQQWLEYCFGKRERPLAAPRVAMTVGSGGLRFEIALDEPVSRLAGARAVLHAATRVDANAVPIQDFKAYTCSLEGDRFTAVIPSGDRPAAGDPYSAANVIYFATVTDSRGLPVSSVAYQAGRMIDLSSGFVPGIDPYSAAGGAVPPPPPHEDAASTSASSLPVLSGAAYQGVSLTNATDAEVAVRVEARTDEGRLEAAEGLINPAFMTIAPRSQRVFLFQEWMGAGAMGIQGSFRFGWSDGRASSLAFRGNVAPPELSEIGPLGAPAKTLWLPLAPEQDRQAVRRLRVFASGSAAAVTAVFRDSSGKALDTRRVDVPSHGSADMSVPGAEIPGEAAAAEINASAPVSARLEVSGAADPWSIEARAIPASPAAVQPHVEWNGRFKTRLLLVNPAAERRSLILRLRAASGALVAPDAVISVDSLSSVSQRVESLFGIAETAQAGAGWIEMEAQGSPVLATALAADPESGATAASALLPPGSGAWSMPFFVESAGYWTGLAILNPGDAPASLELAAHDVSGVLLERVPIVIPARQGKTQLVAQWFPSLAAEATGQIVLSADQPVSLLAYFGTDDQASLAAIPFSPYH